MQGAAFRNVGKQFQCLFGGPQLAAHKTQDQAERAMRKQIQQIMKWSGPRMLWRHPWLALCHLLDSRRKAPRLPNSRPLPP